MIKRMETDKWAITFDLVEGKPYIVISDMAEMKMLGEFNVNELEELRDIISVMWDANNLYRYTRRYTDEYNGRSPAVDDALRSTPLAPNGMDTL